MDAFVLAQPVPPSGALPRSIGTAEELADAVDTASQLGYDQGVVLGTVARAARGSVAFDPLEVPVLAAELRAVLGWLAAGAPSTAEAARRAVAVRVLGELLVAARTAADGRRGLRISEGPPG